MKLGAIYTCAILAGIFAGFAAMPILGSVYAWIMGYENDADQILRACIVLAICAPICSAAVIAIVKGEMNR